MREASRKGMVQQRMSTEYSVALVSRCSILVKTQPFGRKEELEQTSQHATTTVAGHAWLDTRQLIFELPKEPFCLEEVESLVSA